MPSLVGTEIPKLCLQALKSCVRTQNITSLVIELIYDDTFRCVITHSGVCLLTNIVLTLLALWPIFKLFLVARRVRSIKNSFLSTPVFFLAFLLKSDLNW